MDNDDISSVRTFENFRRIEDNMVMTAENKINTLDVFRNFVVAVKPLMRKNDNNVNERTQAVYVTLCRFDRIKEVESRAAAYLIA